MCIGVPGRLVAIEDRAGVAFGVVDVGGCPRDVCLSSLLEEVAVGDWVVCHLGFALYRLAEEDAMRTLELLAELGGMAGGYSTAADPPSEPDPPSVPLPEPAADPLSAPAADPSTRR
jgi:hydrogenase expression/formation protein HypC